MSPVEDISNFQCVNFEASTSGDDGQQSLTSLNCITVRNGECYNQQVNFFFFSLQFYNHKVSSN